MLNAKAGLVQHLLIVGHHPIDVGAEQHGADFENELIDVGLTCPLPAEAIRRWGKTGLTVAQRQLLNHVHFQIADLGGLTLGNATGDTITLDRNAAGRGWFVDKTASDDSEFLKPGNQGEQNRMDLLAVLEHEVGHLLGYEHQTSGVMFDTLPAGTRRTPSGEQTASPIGFWFSGVGKKKDSLFAAWLESAEM